MKTRTIDIHVLAALRLSKESRETRLFPITTFIVVSSVNDGVRNFSSNVVKARKYKLGSAFFIETHLELAQYFPTDAACHPLCHCDVAPNWSD